MVVTKRINIDRFIKEPIFIYGGTSEEAREFAREIGLHPWEGYIYLSNIKKLHGIRDCTIIMTKNWFHNKTVDRRIVEDYASRNNIVIIKC